MSAYLYLVAEVGHLRLQSNKVWEWKNFVTDFESSLCSVTLVGRWKEILRLGCVFSCNVAIWPCVCLRGTYLQSQVVIGWKGVSTPMRSGLDTGLYIGRAIALGLSQGWRAMCTKYGWIASWCCVCYFCTHSYVLQFCACQCCSASYRDCNNPRLIYLDKKSMALPHFARTASSGVSIVAAVSLLTFHKSQVCREKELCFLHCNAFCSLC